MIADAMGTAPLTTTLRVRYVECDMQGHVFNGHYLTWFDMAHTEALHTATGISYPELIAAHGIDFVVAESGVRYLAPAHFDDLLEVTVTFEPLTSSSSNESVHDRLRRGDDRDRLPASRLRGCQGLHEAAVA